MNRESDRPSVTNVVVPIGDIPDHGTLSIELPDRTRVCLIRRGQQISALLDECTHQGMPLSAGEVLPDGTIECPWHGARFDIASGAVRRGPAEDNLETFQVTVVGDSVLVEERHAR